MSTPHIAAKEGDFAKTVLMPGDPLRAKFIAETYLTDAKLVTSIRNVYGYTGYYKGKRVSVMASGMGQPSMGIYSYELYKFYGVEKIIRIGSCGAYDKDLHIKDIIIAMAACSNGNYASQYNLPGTYCPIADFGLVKEAAELAEKANINYKVGNILSSDVFYREEKGYNDLWANMGVLGVEMESAALYCNAARFGKKALCICTVSDSFVYQDEVATPEERQTSFTAMMEIALELA